MRTPSSPLKRLWFLLNLTAPAKYTTTPSLFGHGLMAFPLAPSSQCTRPEIGTQEKYRSMSGSETRIRFGDRRTDATLSLQYQNISDADAQSFG